MDFATLTLSLASARTHVEVVDLARTHVLAQAAGGNALALLDAVKAAHERIRRQDQQTADSFHRSLAAENEPYYASRAPALPDAVAR